MTDWRDETCETCEFRVGERCAFSTPKVVVIGQRYHGDTVHTVWPTVKHTDVCAEHKPNQSKRKDG